MKICPRANESVGKALNCTLLPVFPRKMRLSLTDYCLKAVLFQEQNLTAEEKFMEQVRSAQRAQKRSTDGSRLKESEKI